MNNIENLIPHRKPFLFVDRLEKSDEEGVTGYKNFTAEEFFFKGHFPEYPVVPGVLLVEAMAQCGGAGIRERGILADDSLFFLATVDKVKLRRQVRPNEEVKMVIENVRISSKMIKQKGKSYVNGELAAEAEWLCLVGKK